MNTAQLESLDGRIKKASRASALAPAEFLEHELRRFINRNMVVYGSKGVFSDEDFADITNTLEQEYQCYFEGETFADNLEPHHWWEFVYAGCNSQIEGFLLDNGFEAISEILKKKGFSKGARQLEEEDLFMPLTGSSLDRVRRYLMGIGYLYPVTEGVVKVHANLLLGQLGTEAAYHTLDSPFLTRDLIRCPYAQTQYGVFAYSLSDKELWDYWKDLLALSLGRLSQQVHYTPEHLRGKEKLTKGLKESLKLGRKFVPQRYVELEPQIEKFEWTFPSEWS